VGHAVLDARAAEVLVEGLVVRVAAGGLRRYLLRAAVAAAVRVDRHDVGAGRRRPAQDDRGAAAKGADLDDAARRRDALGGGGEPEGLVVAQPALDVIEAG
jgi:hypothetical protein